MHQKLNETSIRLIDFGSAEFTPEKQRLLDWLH